MMDTLPRILIHDHLDQFICEITPSDLIDIPYVDEVNGEHSITIQTRQVLEKTNRVLIRDAMGIWHEYVVLGLVSTHGATPTTHEYYCVWSLQYDMSVTFVNDQYGCGVVPGHASVPQTATAAMTCALQGTTRWSLGTVTVASMTAASFYRRSGWDALKTVVEKWGGELHATINVGIDGTVTRQVDLLSHYGSSVPTRRFDYGHDVTSIKRTVSEDVWACRIVPLGKAMETETGGYSRRPTIESVNDGVIWLQDDEMVPLTKVPNGTGGWEYPTAIVKNDTYEEPADLKTWALGHIQEYTRPKVTYEADVAEFVKAGLNPHGVSCGDEVIVVDYLFSDEGLAITARVVRITGSMLDRTKTRLTIGNAKEKLSDQMASLSKRISDVGDAVDVASQWQATATYLSNLVARLNDEINVTGGYTYITQGDGIRTYDVAVSDPLVGAEASKVVEVKGGSIRIADARTSQGDWDWKTVFQSGHVAAELVTALAAVAGTIRSASGSTVIDLDNDSVTLGLGTRIGDVSLVDALDDARKYATEYLHFDPTEGLTIGATDSAVRNVLTSSRQVYRTDAGDIAWYGLGEDQIWRLFIDNAQVNDMLQFGQFAWIARSNGNMTVKWLGA